MDSTLVGVIVVVVLNILVSAFSAGKLYQKVNDLCSRIDGLEKKVNNTDAHLDTLSDRISKLEGKLEK